MDIGEGIEVVLKTYANFGYDRKAEEVVKYLKSEGLVRKVVCCAWSQVKDGESWWAMSPCHECNSTGYNVEEL